MADLRLSAPTPLATEHDIKSFDSGEVSLNNWLQKRALKNQAAGASRCFVVCNDKTVVGYYCLSAGAISHEASPKSMRRNMPDPLACYIAGQTGCRSTLSQPGHRSGTIARCHVASRKRLKRYGSVCHFGTRPFRTRQTILSFSRFYRISDSTDDINDDLGNYSVDFS